MPLPVIAVINAKPGSEDVVRKALGDLVGPTRNEAGCLSYSLYQSIDDSTVFVTIESWRGPGDVEQHLQSDHVAQTIASVGNAIAGGPVLHSLVPLDEA